MDGPADFYLSAYDSATKELVGFVVLQERAEKKKLALRKAIQHLRATLETEGIEKETGAEAVCQFENQSLPDEIRNLLKANYPAWMTPNAIRSELRLMGRDLSNYPNPQSAVQMALKRMVESENPYTEEQELEGRKMYRCRKTSSQLARAFGLDLPAITRESGDVLKRMLDDTIESVRRPKK